MIGEQAIWIAVIFGVFTLITGIIGSLCIYTVFTNLNTSNLKIGPDYIDIPYVYKKTTRISFKEIDEVRTLNTYDKLIEIYTKSGGSYLIEQNWMNKKDFREVSNTLNDWKV
ncbi:MAG: hypothetical protein ACI9Y7_001539 [Dokdonia sp.]|jgi:hypothetical protein